MKLKLIHILIIILTLLATVLIGWKIIPHFYPTKEKFTKDFGILPPPEIEGFKNLKGNIEYSFSINNSTLKSWPNSASIYRLKKLTPSESQLDQIAKLFDFDKSPEKKFTLGTPSSFLYYQWTDKKQTLKISPQGEISYKYFSQLDPDFKKTINLPSESEAISIAKKKLSNLGIKEEGYFYLEPSISYFTIGSSNFIETADKNKAEGINIIFVPMLNSLSILLNDPQIPFMAIRISNSGKIISLNCRLFEFDQDTSSIYPIKKYEQIENEIKKGLGKLVYLKGVDLPPGSNLELSLTNIAINEWKLAYLLDQKSLYLQPTFVFSGLAITDIGKNTSVIIYLPAVAQ